MSNVAIPTGIEAVPLDYRQIYAREVIDARKESSNGGLDLYLGAKGVIGGIILEAFQNDYENMVAKGETLDTKNIVAQMATAPVDWKAVALAGATFALASGARRAAKPYTVGADINKAIKKAEGAEDFVPHTVESYSRFKRNRRIKEAVGTTIVTGAAYKIGEKLSMEADLAIGVGLSVGAYTKVQLSRLFYKVRGY